MMAIARAECPECGCTVDGSLNKFFGLDDDSRELLSILMDNNFNMTRTAKQLGVCYQTAKRRVDALKDEISAWL